MTTDNERRKATGGKQSASGFVAAMRSAGIHVGLGVSGEAVICVNCGEPWPCSASIERSADDG